MHKWANGSSGVTSGQCCQQLALTLRSPDGNTISALPLPKLMASVIAALIRWPQSAPAKFSAYRMYVIVPFSPNKFRYSVKESNSMRTH